jgi:hypothetical protein
VPDDGGLRHHPVHIGENTYDKACFLSIANLCESVLVVAKPAVLGWLLFVHRRGTAFDD